MVIHTEEQKIRLKAIKIKIAFFQMKKKIFGKLSEKEEKELAKLIILANMHF